MNNNREIKFRCWDKKNNIFLKPINYNNNNASRSLMINHIGQVFYDEGCEGDYLIMDNVIFQQFTGILDKNKKEIYEGDILQDVKYEDISHIVVWGNLFGGWLLTDKVGKNPDRIQWDNELSSWNKDSKIIGNIFENPELLK